MEFVDAEAMAIAFVESKTRVPAFVLVPKDRPEQFVLVYRTGGAADNRVLESVQLTFEAWAPTTASASSLASRVRRAFLNATSADLPLARSVVETVGPYLEPDDESETPRYRFTFLLHVRATRTRRR